MAHNALDMWLEGFRPFFESEEPPRLEALSDHVQKTRSEFLSACMQAAIEKLYPHMMEQIQAQCPRCGKTLARKRADERKVSTMQGEFSIWRPYFYCTACRHGFHPLDKVLGLAPQHHQHDVQRRVVKTAARVPFAETCEQFEELSGVMVGNHFSHETLNAVAEVATLENVIPRQEEIDARIQLATVSSGPPPVLVVASDGDTPTVQALAKQARKRSLPRSQRGRIYLIGPGSALSTWQAASYSGGRGILREISPDLPSALTSIAFALLSGRRSGWLWNAMVKAFPKDDKSGLFMCGTCLEGGRSSLWRRLHRSSRVGRSHSREAMPGGSQGDHCRP